MNVHEKVQFTLIVQCDKIYSKENTIGIIRQQKFWTLAIWGLLRSVYWENNRMKSKNELSNDRIKKLAEVASMYYLDDMNQGEIAVKMNVSRSVVSRMLTEAKRLGIVEINIHSNVKKNMVAMNKLRNLYGIEGGYFAPDGINDVVVDRAIAEGTINYVKELGGRGLGIGVGTVMGNMLQLMEECEPEPSTYETVCSLIGNFSFSNKKYHANGMVRKYAKYLEAEPVLLHSRSFAKNREDMDKIRNTVSYNRVLNIWDEIDTMVVNIGNYPAESDFAMALQLGLELDEKNAAGRILAYYYDEEGKILKLENTYAVQVLLKQIIQCKNVIGVCAANINAKAVKGALSTGLINHIVMRESLLDEIL